jgi:1-acyl-sn-glycerol-3-phosphate acyltransferase
MGAGSPRHASEETSAALLEVVRRLATELHAQRAPSAPATLDSALDRDLGFDSLSRVELLARIEHAFGVSLSEQLLASAETPRDLLRAVLGAHAARRPAAAPRSRAAAPQAAHGTPRSAQTLTEVLDWHVQAHPRRTHVYLYGDGDAPQEISYAALRDGARAVAAGLQRHGLRPGQTVAIMLPTGREYLYSFFGILLAGAIPVPIYPPVRPSQLEEHLRRHGGILANARAVLLITVAQAKPVARLLKAQVETLQRVLTPGELARSREAFSAPAVRAQDTAFLQYTSGSTGAPKGVILTHANLLANIRAMGEAVHADATDVFVSWLPLYHDMGLIGAWLGSLYHACTVVLMSPLAFLSHPHRWLWAIHEHRGTLSAAPNFGYEFCLSKIDEADLQGLDLGSWRMAFNGAEPVSPRTLRRFTQRFARYGFRREAMAPVYGLAEAAVGLAFPPLGRGPLIDHIRRAPFASRGQALPAREPGSDTLEFVACGQPLPGYQIRIVDPAGHELPERREGRLQFRGPSATSGYFRNPDATRRLFDGDWLDSGDLAYVAGGDVYLTGRSKDIIIRGGRNLYPYELEEAVGELPGIRKGCVAVFGSPDPGSGTERLILVAETRETDPDAREALAQRVRAITTDLLGLAPDEVVLAPLHAVLKTSSGKIRRGAVRELYQRGRLARGSRALWWQLTRVALASLGPRWRRARRRLADMAFAAWAQGVFWSLAPPVWLAIAVLPARRWRWAVMRTGAQALFRLTRVPLHITGIENLPEDRACVLIANHASYLDGIVLVATLPRELGFVAKAELGRRLVPRLFLRRIGAEFVERFDHRQGVADARRTAQVLHGGRSLCFFPEGTFERMPGLAPFHMGAFVVAAQAGAPVVPIVIRGTRSVLRSDSWFPHRAPVSVHIGAPILPQGGDWAGAVRLRDAARAAILDHLGEPDLAEAGPP